MVWEVDQSPSGSEVSRPLSCLGNARIRGVQADARAQVNPDLPAGLSPPPRPRAHSPPAASATLLPGRPGPPADSLSIHP